MTVAEPPDTIDATTPRKPHGMWHLVYVALVVWVVLNRAIPDHLVLPIGVDVRPSQAVLLILLVILTLAMATAPLPGPRGVPALSGMALILVVALTAFLSSSAYGPYQADGAERGLILLTIYTGLFLGSYFIARWDRAALNLLTTVVIMTTMQAVITVYEWRLGAAVVLRWPIWQWLGLGGADVSRGDQFRLSGLFRAQGTSAHPIVASCLVAVAILLIILILIYEDRPRQRRWLFIALAPMALSLAVVNTRSGFVVLIAGLVLIVGLNARLLPRFIPVAVGGVVATGLIAALSPSSLRSSLDLFWKAGEDSSVNVRVERLSSVPELLSQHPFLGNGWLTNNPTEHLFDNTWIVALLEVGIVGTAILVVFLFSSVVRMASARRKATALEMVLLLSGIVGAAALFVSGFTFDALAFDQFLPTCVLLLGLGLAGADRASRRSVFPAPAISEPDS